MNGVQLTQHFRVGSPSIFDECDLLMEALMDAEDEHVFDAAVSADTERGLVIVEVTARGADRYDAEIRALERVRWALIERVRVDLIDELVAERRVAELALA